MNPTQSEDNVLKEHIIFLESSVKPACLIFIGSSFSLHPYPVHRLFG